MHQIFDQVFTKWLSAETEHPELVNYLPIAEEKGFNSVAEWRLATAKRLYLDTKEWQEIEIVDPQAFVPDIIIGPYLGWSMFLDDEVKTSFKDALDMEDFYAWVEAHDRIPKIAHNLPLTTHVILLKTTAGAYIHIEGGHRICAFSYAVKNNLSVNTKFTASVAAIPDEERRNLTTFLTTGTQKI
jgi:hypothetical protein